MLKARVSLIMLIVLSAVFIIGLTKLGAQKTEAQISGFGAECVLNSGDCWRDPVNDKHILDIVDQLKYEGLSSTDLKNSLAKTYADKTIGFSEQVCSKDLLNGTIIKVQYENILGQNNPADTPASNLKEFAGGGIIDSSFSIPRFCDSSKVAISSPGSDGVAGCCPNANYLYVGKRSLFNGVDPNDSFKDMACCPIKSGSAKGDQGYPVFYQDNKCYDTYGGNDNEIVYSAGSDPIVSGADTIGNGLGTSSVYLYKAELPLGAEKSCGNLQVDASGKQLGCALTNDDGRAGIYASIITSNGVSSLILDASDLKNSLSAGLQCQKCYSDGDPIIIENLGSENETPNLILCDLSDTDGPNIKRTALINNSIADTLASLRATDQTNSDYIAQCRARGGIPTAIGCIDPSPIGIITGLIRIALGVVGGVALLELILVGLQYQRGSEDGIKKARERLIATLAGVAVLIFSVLILRILGVNVLDVLPAGSV